MHRVCVVFRVVHRSARCIPTLSSFRPRFLSSSRPPGDEIAVGGSSSGDDLSDTDLLEKPLRTSTELQAAADRIRNRELADRNAQRNSSQRSNIDRNVTLASAVPEPETVELPRTSVARDADSERSKEVTPSKDVAFVDDARNIPELQRAARDAFVASAVDARGARLAFAASVPPHDSIEDRFDTSQDGGPSVRVDYCVFCYHGPHLLNHENAGLLTKFVSDRGFILPKRFTHCCAKHQRQLARTIKRSRWMNLMPFHSKLHPKLRFSSLDPLPDREGLGLAAPFHLPPPRVDVAPRTNAVSAALPDRSLSAMQGAQASVDVALAEVAALSARRVPSQASNSDNKLH